MKFPELYTKSFDYAVDHNECQRFNRSRELNIACKEAIEKNISASYDYNAGHLNSDEAFEKTRQDYGFERTEFVTAFSILQKERDGRISRVNKDWAKNALKGKLSCTNGNNGHYEIDRINPGLLDIFTNRVRNA